MISNSKDPKEKRASLRKALKSGKLLRMPGATSPLVAKLIEQLGFDGVYVSGAVMSNDLGFPDIGMTTLSEVAHRASRIAQVTALPSLVDADTGFGETMNVHRTVKELEYMGLAGCHLEDQENPKRCGHLDHKTLTGVREMCRKIRAASDAKADSNFLVIARTDARTELGLEKAIERAKAYADAGAEMIFPEALADEREFEAFRKAVDLPLLANMTEFGKSRLLTADQLSNLGFNLVIYPVTAQRLAMFAVESGLRHIMEHGTQESILDRMQTRSRLYEVLEYEAYSAFDQSLYNFELTDSQ